MATWSEELGCYQVWDTKTSLLRGLVTASSAQEAVAIQNAKEAQNRYFDNDDK